ncbi:hypothetical protein GGI43DRAFT_386085 [Trichoderma evansii]
MASALETLNNLASSAAKAVWGDSNDAETHKEPISGATGDVSKGEPYDAGNLDPQAQRKVERRLSGEDVPESSELADDEHYTLSSAKKDMDKLSVGAAPADEGVNEPRSTPTTGIIPEEAKPLDKLTGNAPRPVEVVAKENGGNAAAAAAVTEPSAFLPIAPEEIKPEQPVTEQKDTSTLDTSKKEATEEEYVKSSGLAADGGNFDASKPGAGLEADRLLEQKGIKIDDADPKHKDQDQSSSNNSSSGRKSSDSSRKDKPKLKERIKNKLHRH